MLTLRVFQTVWWTIWIREIFQAVLCPTKIFQWKLICSFKQHCLSYKISNKLRFNSIVFLKTLRNYIDMTFSKMCRTFKRRLSTLIPIHISSMGHNRGHISYSLSDKCTALIQNNLLWKWKLTANELWSRFLWNTTSFIENIKKILLLRFIHHLISDLINNMDHMRNAGTEPSSVILSQTK